MMDAATGEAAAKFFNGGSESDEEENEANDTKDLKNLAEFIDHPDGSVTVNPDYLEKVNGQDASELRSFIKESLLIPDDHKKDEPDDMPAGPPTTPTEVGHSIGLPRRHQQQQQQQQQQQHQHQRQRQHQHQQ